MTNRLPKVPDSAEPMSHQKARVVARLIRRAADEADLFSSHLIRMADAQKLYSDPVTIAAVGREQRRRTLEFLRSLSARLLWLQGQCSTMTRKRPVSAKPIAGPDHEASPATFSTRRSAQ